MMHIFRPAAHKEKIEIKEHTILKMFDYLKILIHIHNFLITVLTVKSLISLVAPKCIERLKESHVVLVSVLKLPVSYDGRPGADISHHDAIYTIILN